MHELVIIETGHIDARFKHEKNRLITDSCIGTKREEKESHCVKLKRSPSIDFGFEF